MSLLPVATHRTQFADYNSQMFILSDGNLPTAQRTKRTTFFYSNDISTFIDNIAEYFSLIMIREFEIHR